MSGSSENASTGGKQKRVILWMRNDLRLHDNYVVNEAVRLVKSRGAEEVVPVYIFDPRFFKISAWGSLKTGAHRAQFLMESVVDLKSSLKAIGSDLLVAVGRPENIIPTLMTDCQPGTIVLTQHECTSEEERVDDKVSQAVSSSGGKLQRMWGMTMYHLEDLLAPDGPLPQSLGGLKNLPTVFTPFKEKVESKCQVRPLVPTPTAGSLPLPAALRQPVTAPSTASMAGIVVPLSVERLHWTPEWQDLPWPEDDKGKSLAPEPPKKHPNAVLDFKGGETVALARLKYYLWDSDLLATYFQTRNGMLGGDYSSKFAPWLATGALSPRKVFHEVKKYEDQRVKNKDTYWLIFEMIWRDFYRFFALRFGNKIFFEGGISDQARQWSADPDFWRRWSTGTTGLPLVDANMRELIATGFMSNRGRQNVASQLVLDYGVDWRKGADLFESLLLDYDVASNWGNWVAAAGLTGGRVNKFNITKQAKDYDPKGDYVRAWIPELANVPPAHIFEPWAMSKADQERYNCLIGVDYPAPAASKPPRSWEGGSGQGYQAPRRGGSGPYPQGGRGRGGGDAGTGGRPTSGRGAAGGRGGGSDRKRLNQRKMSEFDRFG